MVRTSSLLVVASWLAAAQASISTQCNNLRFQNRWLIGNCLTGSGTTRIESSVYLQNRIANIEGHLTWRENGAFGASCTDCSVSANPARLSCKCRPTGGQSILTSINLDEHIGVYSGFLLSDTVSTTPPSVVSPNLFPADPSWGVVFGNTSCWSDEPLGTGPCPTPEQGNGYTCPTGGTSVSASDGVANCFAFRWPISTPVWQTFGSIKINAPSGQFKFNVFDTVDCSGGVKGTVLPGELGTCKDFFKQMRAFQAVQLWNGQT